jgi:hypothetical protein
MSLCQAIVICDIRFLHCIFFACYFTDHLSIVIHVRVASHLMNVISAAVIVYLCEHMIFYSFLKFKVRREKINLTMMFLFSGTQAVNNT